MDSEIGGASPTGVGEDIMKGCLCFLAVSLMKQGMLPQAAAEEAVRRTQSRLSGKSCRVDNIALVCADRHGRFGGAANHDGFSYVAAGSGQDPAVFLPKPVAGDCAIIDINSCAALDI